MQNIRLIVTGGYGFIGSHFIKLALKNNVEIVNLDKKTYAANLKIIDNFKNMSNLTNVIGDITNSKLVDKLFKEFKPNGIINFAAETHVDNSISSASNFINTNILGTHNLLNASVSYLKSNLVNKFRFIQISTDEVFGSLKNSGFFNENSPICPRNPYSATKASADHLVFSWYNTYKLPVIISNCSNNFGPFQHTEKLIPKTIKSIINNEMIGIYGNGKNVRDWLYVKDHTLGILNLFKFGKIGERYCIGGGKELSNIDLVKFVCKIVDKELKLEHTSEKLINFVDDRPGHDFRYAIDDKKIRSELSYTNVTSFQKAMYDTVKWYINYFTNQSTN